MPPRDPQWTEEERRDHHDRLLLLEKEVRDLNNTLQRHLSEEEKDRRELLVMLQQDRKEMGEALQRIELKQANMSSFTAGAAMVIAALSAAIGAFWGKITIHV